MNRRCITWLLLVLLMGNALVFLVYFTKRDFSTSSAWFLQVYYFLAFLFLANYEEKHLYQLWGWFVFGNLLPQVSVSLYIFSWNNVPAIMLGAIIMWGSILGIAFSGAAYWSVRLYRGKQEAETEN